MGPEEERGLVQRLMSGSISGLQRLGWFLDLPGSTIRGILSGATGGPWKGGFLNIPRGWEAFWSPYEHVTGRELGERWGMLDPNRYRGLESFAHLETPEGQSDLAQDIAGFGIEMALDPFAWMTFGPRAATRAATVGRKAGLLDDIAKVATQKAGRQVGKREAPFLLNLEDVIKATPKPEVARKAAEAAAGGSEALRPLLTQPLGASFGIRGFPLGPVRGSVTLRGAQKRAAWRDTLANWLGGTRTGRIGKAGFQPSVMGAFGREAQEIAPEVYAGITQAGRYARGAEFQAIKEVERLGVKPDAARQLLHYFVENEPNLRAINTAAGRQFQQRLAALTPEQLEGFRQVAGGLRDELGTVGQAMRDQGLRLPEALQERGMAYFARYLLAGRRAGATRGRLLDPRHQSMLSRVEHLMDVPQAKMDIMAHDPRLVGAERLGLDEAADLIQREYLEHAPTPGLAGLVAGSPPAVGDPAWTAITDELARFLRKTPDDIAALPVDEFRTAANSVVSAYRSRAKAVANTLANQGKPGPFWKHPLEAYVAYLLHGQESVTASRGIFQLIGKYAKPMMGETEDIVPLEKLLTDTRHADIVNPRIASATAWENAAEAIRGQGRDLGDVSSLMAWGVPAQIASDATRMMKGFTVPEFLREAAQVYDSFLNFWKASVTSIWPGFAARNRLSGVVNNALSGAFDLGAERAAGRLLKFGEPIKDAAKWPAIRNELQRRGLPATDEAATEVFQEFVYANDLIGRRQMQVDLPMAGLETAEWAIPGARPMPKPILGRLQTLRKQPFFGRKGERLRGVAGAEETTAGLYKAGEELNWYVEAINRTGPFAALLKKGWDPAAAASRVKQIQVDYANRAHTAFERAMFRLFPFGKFTRGMAKHVVKELSEKPGGGLAQFIRATDRMRGEPTEILPPYVAESAAIRIPSDMPLLGPAGADAGRYLTGGGFMHEDPLAFLGGGVRRGLLEGLSRMTPAVKAPLEWATGESFFQHGTAGGRPLQELDPTVGRLLANITGAKEPIPWAGGLTPAAEQLLANLPTTRLMTTARTLTDPRKRLEETVLPGPAALLNVLTGLRVMDIPEAARRRILQEQINEALLEIPGARQFERPYIPAERLQMLPPHLQQRAQEVEALRAILQRRARAMAG